MHRFWGKDNEALLSDVLFAGLTWLEMFRDSWVHGHGALGRAEGVGGESGDSRCHKLSFHMSRRK